MVKKLSRESFFFYDKQACSVKCTVCAVRAKNILPYKKIKIWAFTVMARMCFFKNPMIHSANDLLEEI